MKKLLLLTLFTFSTWFLNAQERAFGDVTRETPTAVSTTPLIIDLDVLVNPFLNVIKTEDLDGFLRGGIAFPAGVLSESQPVVSLRYACLAIDLISSRARATAELYWTQEPSGDINSLHPLPNTQRVITNPLTPTPVLEFSGVVNLSQLSPHFDPNKPFAVYLVLVSDRSFEGVGFTAVRPNLAVDYRITPIKSFGTVIEFPETQEGSGLLKLDLLVPPFSNVNRTAAIGLYQGGIAFTPEILSQFEPVIIYDFTLDTASIPLNPNTIFAAELVWIQDFSTNILDYHEYTPSFTHVNGFVATLQNSGVIDLRTLPGYDPNKPFALYLFTNASTSYRVSNARLSARVVNNP